MKKMVTFIGLCTIGHLVLWNIFLKLIDWTKFDFVRRFYYWLSMPMVIIPIHNVPLLSDWIAGTLLIFLNSMIWGALFGILFYVISQKLHKNVA